MIRSLIPVLILSLICSPVFAAEPPVWLDAMPEEEPSIYISPLELLKGVPKGRVTFPGDLVCADPVAAARSISVAKLAKGLSDDRARASWGKGWRSGQLSALPSLRSEHSGRVAAEAKLQALSGEGVPLVDSILTFPLTPLAIAALGVIAGYQLGK